MLFHISGNNTFCLNKSLGMEEVEQEGDHDVLRQNSNWNREEEKNDNESLQIEMTMKKYEGA